MPTEHEYTLQDLADLADVTPRTIRYYVAQGLLPSPGRVGPGATYGAAHLARLRLIRQLAREHLPLAEIRNRLAFLDDATVLELLETPPARAARESAAEYIRDVLSGPTVRAAMAPSPAPPAPSVPRFMRTYEPAAPDLASLAAPLAAPVVESPAPTRSQWDRVELIPDVELHIRRPLSRHVNKQVERLIAIARQLLEEDPS